MLNVENVLQQRPILWHVNECVSIVCVFVNCVWVRKIYAYICIDMNWISIKVYRELKSNRATTERGDKRSTPSHLCELATHSHPPCIVCWETDDNYNDAAFFNMYTNDVLGMDRYCAVLLWCNCCYCCIIGIWTIIVYGHYKSYTLFHWWSSENGCRWSAWSPCK